MQNSVIAEQFRFFANAQILPELFAVCRPVGAAVQSPAIAEDHPEASVLNRQTLQFSLHVKDRSLCCATGSEAGQPWESASEQDGGSLRQDPDVEQNERVASSKTADLPAPGPPVTAINLTPCTS